jgi:hypothetical protein
VPQVGPDHLRRMAPPRFGVLTAFGGEPLPLLFARLNNINATSSGALGPPEQPGPNLEGTERALGRSPVLLEEVDLALDYPAAREGRADLAARSLGLVDAHHQPAAVLERL